MARLTARRRGHKRYSELGCDPMEQQIGKFALKKKLGKGASGTVYLALDTFSGDDVALKVLDTQVLLDPAFDKTFCRQFMNEASLAGKLSHPHIAAILEATVTDDAGYIALEFVPGGDLTQFVTKDRLLPVEDAVEIAFKCCGALDYAHRQGIIHRDIKPANVLVVEGTNIKVSDFGAAYLHGATSTQVNDVGSPLYMAPEQIRGGKLGHHSDMFSLGVLLYELLTGERPFQAKTLPELIDAICDRTPEPPSSLREGVKPGLDRIVMKMLHKLPDERYADWAELALELADVGRLSTFHQAIPDSEKFVALRKIPVLERLGDSEIWELAHGGRWSRMRTRDVIMREGEAGNSLFFLAGGEVKVTKHGRLLNVLAAGEYFGEMAYLKAGAIPRQATAEALTDGLIAEFQADALKNVSKACQLELANALLQALVDRLAFADERITQTATQAPT